MNENLLEKKTVKTVINYLHNFDPNFSPICLDTTARTAKDAATSLKVEIGSIVKSLIFRSIKENLYYLCLISGDRFISLMNEFFPKWKSCKDELYRLPVRHEDWKY